MIRSQTRVISFKSGRKTHQDRRPTYGKIKVTPPYARQAIAMARLLAGASVGARAARRQKPNNSNVDFGTRPPRRFERADK